MSPLHAVRTCLVADVELNNFMTEQYNKPLKHLIGFRLGLKADDYPIISYVNADARYDNKRKTLCNDFSIALIVGLNDSMMLDENGSELSSEESGKAQFLEFRGVVNGEKIAELIIDAVQKTKNLNGYFITSDFIVVNELPPKYPFFNFEIDFQMRIKT